MRVATWNINKPGMERARNLARFLDGTNWDVVALQEVTPAAWSVLTRSRIAEDGSFTLEGFDVSPPSKRPHGVALMARNGFRLSEPTLIPDIPKVERGIAATTVAEKISVTVASWHAPNAAGEGVEVKMRVYRGIIDWLNTVEGAIVLGFDSNHWSRSIDLEPPHVPDSKDRWLLENQFFGSNAPHRLRDAFLDHLRRHPLEYQDIKERRPQGPLAVSYVRRGSARQSTEDRFDYIFTSREISVTNCSYDYEGAKAAGSDHGIVTADLSSRT